MSKVKTKVKKKFLINPDFEICKKCAHSKFGRLRYCPKHREYISKLKKNKVKCGFFQTKPEQKTLDSFS